MGKTLTSTRHREVSGSWQKARLSQFLAWCLACCEVTFQSANKGICVFTFLYSSASEQRTSLEPDTR